MRTLARPSAVICPGDKGTRKLCVSAYGETKDKEEGYGLLDEAERDRIEIRLVARSATSSCARALSLEVSRFVVSFIHSCAQSSLYLVCQGFLDLPIMYSTTYS